MEGWLVVGHLKIYTPIKMFVHPLTLTHLVSCLALGSPQLHAALVLPPGGGEHHRELGRPQPVLEGSGHGLTGDPEQPLQ